MTYLIDQLERVRKGMKTEIANTDHDKDLLSALASLDNSLYYLQAHMEKERKRALKRQQEEEQND